MNQQERTAALAASEAAALDAYVLRMEGIREQLETISNALTDRVSPDDVTWGHVGDLAHVHSELADIVAFLTGETPAAQTR